MIKKTEYLFSSFFFRYIIIFFSSFLFSLTIIFKLHGDSIYGILELLKFGSANFFEITWYPQLGITYYLLLGPLLYLFNKSIIFIVFLNFIFNLINSFLIYRLVLDQTKNYNISTFSAVISSIWISSIFGTSIYYDYTAFTFILLGLQFLKKEDFFSKLVLVFFFSIAFQIKYSIGLYALLSLFILEVFYRRRVINLSLIFFCFAVFTLIFIIIYNYFFNFDLITNFLNAFNIESSFKSGDNSVDNNLSKKLFYLIKKLILSILLPFNLDFKNIRFDNPGVLIFLVVIFFAYYSFFKIYEDLKNENKILDKVFVFFLFFTLITGSFAGRKDAHLFYGMAYLVPICIYSFKSNFRKKISGFLILFIGFTFLFDTIKSYNLPQTKDIYISSKEIFPIFLDINSMNRDLNRKYNKKEIQKVSDFIKTIKKKEDKIIPLDPISTYISFLTFGESDYLFYIFTNPKIRKIYSYLHLKKGKFSNLVKKNSSSIFYISREYYNFFPIRNFNIKILFENTDFIFFKIL